jgi:hypothetical protein
MPCRASFPNGGRRWRCPGTCEHCSGSMKHVIVRGYGQIIISAASFPVIWWRLTPPLGSFQNFSPHQTLPCLSQLFHRSSSLTYTYAIRPFLYTCFHTRYFIVLHAKQVQSMMSYKLLTFIRALHSLIALRTSMPHNPPYQSTSCIVSFPISPN